MILIFFSYNKILVFVNHKSTQKYRYYSVGHHHSNLNSKYYYWVWVYNNYSYFTCIKKNIISQKKKRDGVLRWYLSMKAETKGIMHKHNMANQFRDTFSFNFPMIFPFLCWFLIHVMCFFWFLSCISFPLLITLTWITTSFFFFFSCGNKVIQ